MMLMAICFGFMVGLFAGAIIMHNDYKKSAEAGKPVTCGGKVYKMVEINI